MEALSNTCCPVSSLSPKSLSFLCHTFLIICYGRHLCQKTDTPPPPSPPQILFHTVSGFFSQLLGVWNPSALLSRALAVSQNVFLFTFVNPVSYTSELNLDVRRRMFPLFFPLTEKVCWYQASLSFTGLTAFPATLLHTSNARRVKICLSQTKFRAIADCN